MKIQNKLPNQEELSLSIKEDESYIRNVNKMINTLPKPIDQEEYRTAASIISGFYSNKTLNEIIKHYSLSKESSYKWWNYFGFNSNQTNNNKAKKGSKSSSLDSFVKENIGKTFKSNEILSICDITNPTLYNYINANRGYFKKVGRGLYEIIDASEERSKVKKVK